MGVRMRGGGGGGANVKWVVGARGEGEREQSGAPKFLQTEAGFGWGGGGKWSPQNWPSNKEEIESAAAVAVAAKAAAAAAGVACVLPCDHDR